MSVSTLTNTVGTGLWAAGSALFLTRGAGLSAAAVGTCLTVAGLVGLAASVPFGNLADRRDPGRLRALVQVLQSATAASFVLVDDVRTLVLVAVLDACLGAGALTLRGALIASIAAPDLRVHAFAVLRTAASTGIGVGGALAGVALAVDSRPAYQVLALARAAAYLASAALHLRLPRLPPVGAQRPRRRYAGALRDLPYVGVMAVAAVPHLNNVVVFFVVPLWVAQQTDAPLPLVSGLLLLRTVLSVLFTVPASRGLDTTARAGRAIRRAGCLLAVGMLLLAATGVTCGAATTLLLVLATVVCAAGELLYVSAGSALSYALADQQRIGNYQGVSNLLNGLVLAAGPALLAVALLRSSPAGWVGLAGVFGAVALAIPGLVTWADRTRPTT